MANMASTSSNSRQNGDNQPPMLSDEAVMAGFHLFIVNSLAQAKLEGIIDSDLLVSAAADSIQLMGPALVLYFAALRSTTSPPSVPLPRSALGNQSPSSSTPLMLSYETCPPVFKPFFKLWAQTVPSIQALPSSQQHDLARIICDKSPVATSPNATSATNDPSQSPNALTQLYRLAADLRSVAIEIAQRRSFQERYRQDLQSALDIGGPSHAKERRFANFVPPPSYEDLTPSTEPSVSPLESSNASPERHGINLPTIPEGRLNATLPPPPIPTTTAEGMPGIEATIESTPPVGQAAPIQPISTAPTSTSLNSNTSASLHATPPNLRQESNGVLGAVIRAGNVASLGHFHRRDPSAGTASGSGGSAAGSPPTTNRPLPLADTRPLNVPGNKVVANETAEAGNTNGNAASAEQRPNLPARRRPAALPTTGDGENVGASTSSGQLSPSLLAPDSPAIDLIRETLYAALAEVIALNPPIKQQLVTDPARAYFSSVSLSILTVSTHCLTLDAKAIMTPLGHQLTINECPPDYRPLMHELIGIGVVLKEWTVEDRTRRDMARVERREPEEPRKERLKRMLLNGVAAEEERYSRMSPPPPMPVPQIPNLGNGNGNNSARSPNRYAAPSTPPPGHGASSPPPGRSSYESGRSSLEQHMRDEALLPPPNMNQLAGSSSGRSSPTPRAPSPYSTSSDTERRSDERRRSAEHPPSGTNATGGKKTRRGSSGSEGVSGALRGLLRKPRPPPVAAKPPPPGERPMARVEGDTVVVDVPSPTRTHQSHPVRYNNTSSPSKPAFMQPPRGSSPGRGDRPVSPSRYTPPGGIGADNRAGIGAGGAGMSVPVGGIMPPMAVPGSNAHVNPTPIPATNSNLNPQANTSPFSSNFTIPNTPPHGSQQLPQHINPAFGAHHGTVHVSGSPYEFALGSGALITGNDPTGMLQPAASPPLPSRNRVNLSTSPPASVTSNTTNTTSGYANTNTTNTSYSHPPPAFDVASPPARRSLEGTTIQMANRINSLALRMTSLTMFKERQDMVFKILASVTD